MASRNRVKLEPESEERLQNLLEFYEKVPETVALLTEMEKKLMASFEDLEAAVRHNSDVTRSAAELIRGLAGRVAACGTDPEKLAKLVGDLNADAGSLADAVAANTKAEPTEQQQPDPVPAEPQAPAGPPVGPTDGGIPANTGAPDSTAEPSAPPVPSIE